MFKIKILIKKIKKKSPKTVLPNYYLAQYVALAHVTCLRDLKLVLGITCLLLNPFMKMIRVINHYLSQS